MDSFTLNKENPRIEFKLSSEESYLLIKSVCVIGKNDLGYQWTNFISKVKLTAELKYFVYLDSERRFVEDRQIQFPIHILTDLYQTQAVFYLNKYIRNEIITLGMNPLQRYYQILKLELHDIEELDDNYTLQFNIEKFKIND